MSRHLSTWVVQHQGSLGVGTSQEGEALTLLQKRKRDQIVKDVTEPYVAIWEKVLDNEASTADQLWDL